MTEICLNCGKECKDSRGLSVHIKACNQNKTFICKHCNIEFKSSRTLSMHYNTCKALKEKEYEDKISLLRLQFEEQIKLKENELLSIGKELKLKCEELKLKDQDLKRIETDLKSKDELIKTKEIDIKLKDAEIKRFAEESKESKLRYEKLENEYSSLKEEFRRVSRHSQTLSSSCINALSSQSEKGKTIINNIATANIGNNTLQLQHFDPSIFTGKIDPPHVMVDTEERLIDYLKSLGFCNYYRVTDRSRKSLLWYDKEGTEIRDTNGSQIVGSILQALEPDIQKQIRWHEQRIEEISRRPNAHEYSDDIMDHGKKLAFCRAMLHPVHIKTMSKITKGVSEIAKTIKDKSIDQIVERKETFNSFVALLQLILLPKIDRWFNLSTSEFALFLERELNDDIIIEPGSATTKTIFIKNDDEKKSPVNSVTFSELLHEALSSASEDLLVETIAHLNKQLPSYHPTFSKISEDMFEEPCELSREMLFDFLCKSRRQTAIPTCSLR